MWAAYRGHTGTVKLLIAAHADVTKSWVSLTMHSHNGMFGGLSLSIDWSNCGLLIQLGSTALDYAKEKGFAENAMATADLEKVLGGSKDVSGTATIFNCLRGSSVPILVLWKLACR